LKVGTVCWSAIAGIPALAAKHSAGGLDQAVDDHAVVAGVARVSYENMACGIDSEPFVAVQLGPDCFSAVPGGTSVACPRDRPDPALGFLLLVKHIVPDSGKPPESRCNVCIGHFGILAVYHRKTGLALKSGIFCYPTDSSCRCSRRRRIG